MQPDDMPSSEMFIVELLDLFHYGLFRNDPFLDDSGGGCSILRRKQDFVFLWYDLITVTLKIFSSHEVVWPVFSKHEEELQFFEEVASLMSDPFEKLIPSIVKRRFAVASRNPVWNKDDIVVFSIAESLNGSS